MNQELESNYYLVLPRFIPVERAKSLSQELIENQGPGDRQVPGAGSLYNYVSCLELLCEKTPEVSRLCGETVLPTYAYARVYGKGQSLARHRDRPACEISLTLNLDGDQAWPIWIESPGKADGASVTLGPGDAMMYLGTVAEHWREQFDGGFCTQVFMHYVRSRGPYSYAYFDRRPRTERKPVEVAAS